MNDKPTPGPRIQDRDGLGAQWTEVFGRPPPSNLSQHLLAAGISYELQCRGGRRIGRRRHEELLRLAVMPSVRPPTQPRAGAQLVREWNGITHIIDVTAGGFIYRDRTYKSLTSIAYEITGARWSGPRFFGLKPRSKNA